MLITYESDTEFIVTTRKKEAKMLREFFGLEAILTGDEMLCVGGEEVSNMGRNLEDYDRVSHGKEEAVAISPRLTTF